MKTTKLMSIMTAAIMAVSVMPATIVSVSANENTAVVEQDKVNSDFDVTIDGVEDLEGNDGFTTFTVSYKGKGADKLEKDKGGVIAWRHAPDGVNYNAWTPLSAFTRDNYNGTSSTLAITKAGSIQFAVTTMAYPRKPYYDVDLSTDAKTLAVSEGYNVIYTDNGYVRAPFLKKATPSVQSTIRPVKQDISVQFDEAMKLVDPSKPVTIEVETTGRKITYEVSNINWSLGTAQATDGADNWRTIDVTNINFTFTPDKTYQGSDNYYSFKVKNLVGVNSGKEANAFNYRTSMRDEGLCVYSSHIFSVMNVKKVADKAIDLTGFKGTGIANTSNIILVAEKDGKKASFDLSFNCYLMNGVMKTGKTIKLGVPYPENFDAREGSVTYKAYYFVKDAKGNYTAKELKTQISDLGLEVVGTL